MNEVSQTNNCPYNLRYPRILASKHKSTLKDVNKTAFKGPQIWHNIPLEIRNLESFQIEYKIYRDYLVTAKLVVHS